MGPTDQIWVKAGFYSLSNQIKVNKYVAIYGGFNGTETSSSQRDWENNITLVNGNNSVRCFYITAPAIIDGFNIRRGMASSANGGGIYIDSSPVYCSMLDFYHVAKIKNCIINQNTAGVHGGGIYDFESDPVITNCTFIGNSATCGGGIKNWQSSSTIEKCRFRANQSTASGSWGNGIRLRFKAIRLRNYSGTVIGGASEIFFFFFFSLDGCHLDSGFIDFRTYERPGLSF